LYINIIQIKNTFYTELMNIAKTNLMLISLLFFIRFSASAQDEYFETFDDYILLKVNANNQTLNLALAPRANGITRYGQRIWYSPTVQNAFGVGVKFKNLSLSYSFKLSQSSLVKNTIGTSKYSDIQMHSYGKWFGYDIYYQKFEGFYIANLENLFNSVQSGTSFPRRDDLKLQNIGANLFFVLNPKKFSYAAAFGQEVAQIKSGGSFLVNSSFGYSRSTADTGFIPPDIDIEFAPEAYFNDAWFLTAVLCPGYAYTYVHRTGIYGSLGATPGIGIVYREAFGDAPTETGVNYFLKGIGRSAIGFNNEKWTFGVSLTTDIQAMNLKAVQFRTNNLNIGVFVGYRIKTKFMAGKKSIFDFSKKPKNE
jgi:hypothetical protein